MTNGFASAALAVMRQALGASAEFRDGQLAAIEAVVPERKVCETFLELLQANDRVIPGQRVTDHLRAARLARRRHLEAATLRHDHSPTRVGKSWGFVGSDGHGSSPVTFNVLHQPAQQTPSPTDMVQQNFWT